MTSAAQATRSTLNRSLHVIDPVSRNAGIIAPAVAAAMAGTGRTPSRRCRNAVSTGTIKAPHRAFTVRAQSNIAPSSNPKSQPGTNVAGYSKPYGACGGIGAAPSPAMVQARPKEARSSAVRSGPGVAVATIRPAANTATVDTTIQRSGDVSRARIMTTVCPGRNPPWEGVGEVGPDDQPATILLRNSGL